MAKGLDLSGLDEKLMSLMHLGPEVELSRTVNAQPAVLAVSLALWQNSDYHKPVMVMGHSLGEYSALVVSGALRAADGLSLVRARGRFMEESEPGGMAAVMGLSPEMIKAELASRDGVWVANINAPGQVIYPALKRLSPPPWRCSSQRAAGW